MKNRAWLLVLGSSVFLTGCHLDMWIQPKVKSQSENNFYSDGKGTRLPVEGTVAFGEAKADNEFYTGFTADGKLVKEFPIAVDEALLKRGKERYDIFCSHCHGAIGDGKGMIAQRGFEMARPVGDYHTDRLREMPVGHLYDVITNGYGTMYPQGARVKPLDRWAIVAYVRALQLSQYAGAADLDADAAKKLGVSPGGGFGPLFVPKAGVEMPPMDDSNFASGEVEEAGDAPTEEPVLVEGGAE